MKNYHEILGISKDATIEEIEEVYQRLKSFDLITEEILEARDVLINLQQKITVNKDNHDVVPVKLDLVDNASTTQAKLEENNTNNDLDKKDNQKEHTMVYLSVILIAAALFLLLKIIINNHNLEIAKRSEETSSYEATKSNNSEYSEETQEEEKYYSENDYYDREGYTDLINNIEIGDVLIGIINNQGLNIRSGLGMNHSIIGYLNEESFVFVFGEFNDWYDICYPVGEDLKFGWVYYEYLDVYAYDYDTELYTDYIIQSSAETTSYSNSNTSTNQTSTSIETSSTETSTVTAKKSYFTIGSSKEDVINIMGDPTGTSSNSLSYKYSSVYLNSNDEVIGFSDISNNLKVHMGNADGSYFTLGSSKEEVLGAMGTPKNVSIYGNSYGYEYSTIYFDSSNKVSDYSNISNNLKLK